MSESLPKVYLARHGETAWTISRQHTGRTDIPLTSRGEANARSLGERLKGETFELVFVSPLGRARRTCELAGFGAQARPEADLLEWDYGAYEGRTTAEIRASGPDGTSSGTAVPGVSRSRRSAPGPTASSLASNEPAAASSSSAMATSSASWPRAGWACRRRTRAISGWAPRRCAFSATSTPWTNRSSSSGMTTDMPFPDLPAPAPLPAVASDNLGPHKRTPSHANASHSRRGNQEDDGPTTGPSFSPDAPRAVRTT